MNPQYETVLAMMRVLNAWMAVLIIVGLATLAIL